MSTSKAIKPKRDETMLSNWESIPERAPSIERDDQPVVARILAMIGLFLLVLGGLAIAAANWQRVTIITPDWGYRIASVGLMMILYHMFVERDFQFRRLYGFLGVALLLGGLVLRLLAFRQASANWFILGGVPSLFIGLVLCVAVIRHETEATFRDLMLNLLGILGGLMIGFAMLRGAIVDAGQPIASFLPIEGALLLILGLMYVCSYIGLQESTSERGYFAGLGLGAVAILGFVIGLILSIANATFLVPAGLILMGMSLIYLLIAVGVCVDWPVIVLARRELAAYFLSPVAYLVLGGQLIFGWIMFTFFVNSIIDSMGPRGRPMFEPIIINYVLSIIPVFVHMFFVPALTMRLLSEEQRSGTLEVLLTAPVNEVSVVAGKFIAAWIFYMLLWLPWWIFLISLRYFGGEPFDYRPVLSFMVSVGVLSAGFMAMGLFCSSLTSNQIVAAVFTFVGMMAHLAIYFAGGMIAPGSAIAEVLSFVNFVDLWIESLRGTLVPRNLMFHASLALFFLFATVKVLESRKWK